MGISPFQIIVILVLGVLIFGKNLPEVARQIGLGLIEFKKGMNELSESSKKRSMKSSTVNGFSSTEPSEQMEKHELLGTKFEPPISG